MTIINITLNKKKKIIIHLAVWLVLFGIFPLLLYIDSFYDDIFLKRSLFQVVALSIIFYTNYFILIPRFYFKNKNLEFYSFLIGLVLLFLFVYTEFEIKLMENSGFNNHIEMPHSHICQKSKDDKALYSPLFKRDFPEMEKKRGKPSKRWPLYNFLLISLLISGISIGLRLAEKYIQNERLRKETEKEKLNSELAFLKNQISPHFFFNTLNNIYSLVEINTEDGQKAILQLSKLMRYLLYESEKGNTLLSREIEFMTNFIELMKLRLSNKIQLKITFPKKYVDFEIPPLLFISFIENAFKHGISYIDSSFINVNMSVNKNEIQFWCSNSLINREKEKNEIKASSGIGLENVKKRLELLFPKRHNLVISSTEVFFSVLLTIDITKTKS